MRHQLGLTAPIHIVPNGVRPMPPSTVARSDTPEIAVVTRLVPHKRLHLLVEAMPSLLHRWPGLHVYLAGDGPARAGLMALGRRLGLEQHLSLPGRVPEQVKADLLSRAWLTVAPSLAEGWGLTVLEANSLGTPAVAYAVPGLRDSVRGADGGTRALFAGSDERTAARALERVRVPPAKLYLASSIQVLCASGEGGLE